VLEIRPDFEDDPDANQLVDFLFANQEYERASSRRLVLVHTTALLGIPVWLAAIGRLNGAARELSLAMFALALAALFVAIISEHHWHSAARHAESRLHATRGTGP
jgi:hypothetical protein